MALCLFTKLYASLKLCAPNKKDLHNNPVLEVGYMALNNLYSIVLCGHYVFLLNIQKTLIFPLSLSTQNVMVAPIQLPQSF